jgi:HEAT repeat protein
VLRRLLVLSLLVASLAEAREDARLEARRLVTALVEGSVGLNQAVNRLRFLGQQGWAAGQLAAALRQGVEERRHGPLVEAVAQLAVPGDEEVERLLLRSLAAEDVAERLSAVRGLGQVRSPRARAPLSALLKERSPGVRREAARALGHLAEPRAGAALLVAARAEDDVEARAAMLEAVGRSGDRSQAAGLETFLGSGSEASRLAAARGLCLLGAPRGLAFARAQLRSEDRQERLAGVQLFEGLKGRAGQSVLTVALTDPDARVRATAGRILYQAGEARRLDWLVLESAKLSGEDRLAFEDQLEQLRLTDAERSAILQRGGGR